MNYGGSIVLKSGVEWQVDDDVHSENYGDSQHQHTTVLVFTLDSTINTKSDSIENKELDENLRLATFEFLLELAKSFLFRDMHQDYDT